ncbi:MAG: glycosyltransferase, partial [Bacteroidaceae bacterium]|nr:glycosyltransferase [Bacteroidaceae bacterium]
LCADGLQDDVIFVDPTNVIEQYYMAFDCFVFPSLFEGLSVAGLEAQAAGLPVLASDALTKELNVTGAVEYLPLSDMGIWVDALDKLHGHCKDSERVTERRVLQGRSFDKTKYSLSQSNLYLVDTISELAARNGIREC